MIRIERIEREIASSIRFLNDTPEQRALRDMCNDLQYGITWIDEAEKHLFPGKLVGLVLKDKIDHDFSWVVLRRQKGGYELEDHGVSEETEQAAEAKILASMDVLQDDSVKGPADQKTADALLYLERERIRIARERERRPAIGDDCGRGKET